MGKLVPLVDHHGAPLARTRLLGRKDSRTGPAIYFLSMGQPVWTPLDYEKLAKEGYEQNPVVYASIRMLVRAFTSVPLLLFRKGTEGELEEIEKHPLLDLVNKRANPYETSAQFKARWLSFLLLAGNAYTEWVGGQIEGKFRKVRRQRKGKRSSKLVFDQQQQTSGKPEIYALRADRVKVTPNSRGYPKEYTYEVGGQRKATIPANVLWHEKLFHPTDDFYGLPVLMPSARTIDVHNEALAFQMSLLRNRATPSGALVYKGTSGFDSLPPEQFDRLQQQLDDDYAGPENAGRPLLLDGGLEWVPMSSTPEDLELQQGQQAAAREIALAFGVPPMLLGIPGDNTFANFKEANQAFWRQTVLPLLGDFCIGLSHFAQSRFGQDDELELRFDEDQIMALSPDRESIWTRVSQNKDLSANERRAAIGYEPYQAPADGNPADMLFQPAGELPLEMANAKLGDETSPAPASGDTEAAATGISQDQTEAEDQPPLPDQAESGSGDSSKGRLIPLRTKELTA